MLEWTRPPLVDSEWLALVRHFDDSNSGSTFWEGLSELWFRSHSIRQSRVSPPHGPKVESVGTPEISSIERVRLTLGQSTDPRASRTRAKLIDAAEALVSRRHPSITVAEIIKEAGVSKTTFYSHFASIDELALQIVERAYSEVAALNKQLRESSNVGAYAATRASFELLVAHYIEHLPFYRSVLALHLSREVHTNAVRSMAADIEPGIRDHPDLPPGVRAHLTASLIASTVVGFLDEWMEEDFEATGEELVDHLMTLLPAWYVGRTDEPGPA